MLARFFNLTVGTEKTFRVEQNGAFKGYNARAIVYSQQGTIIGSAEASCFNDEQKWISKPEFQLKSMAQTRACAKALRNVLAWVVVLEGFSPTPAEEMDSVNPAPAAPSYVPYANQPANKPAYTPAPRPVQPQVHGKLECSECHIEIAQVVSDYSLRRFNKELCRDCQGHATPLSR